MTHVFSDAQKEQITQLIRLAWVEDRVNEDATSRAIFKANDTMQATLTARETLIFAGEKFLPIFLEVMAIQLPAYPNTLPPPLAISHYLPQPLAGGARGGQGIFAVKPHSTRKAKAQAQAQLLRDNPTEAEKKLWHQLLAKSNLGGFRFRRQHPVGEYIADFVCMEKKLIIELDGGQHNQATSLAYDKKRSRFLEQGGYRILRFWNNDVMENLEGVGQIILQHLHAEYAPAASVSSPAPPASASSSTPTVYGSSHTTPPACGGGKGGAHDIVREEAATDDMPPLTSPPQAGGIRENISQAGGIRENISQAGGIITEHTQAEMIDQVLSSLQTGKIKIQLHAKDGELLKPGAIIGIVSGNAAHVLAHERTLLNFLQRLCGVATLTRKYVDAVAGTKAKILDTRKTIPGWRVLDKYAVVCGGGVNHRMDLASEVMIKDNHIAAAGNLQKAIEAVLPLKLPIVVECDTLEQVRAALEFPVTRLLLDNMPLNMLKQAVAFASGKIPLEASGGVNLKNIRQIAETGVDYISVGAITHSATAVDIGLDIHGE